MFKFMFKFMFMFKCMFKIKQKPGKAGGLPNIKTLKGSEKTAGG